LEFYNSHSPLNFKYFKKCSRILLEENAKSANPKELTFVKNAKSPVTAASNVRKMLGKQVIIGNIVDQTLLPRQATEHSVLLLSRRRKMILI
jgi:hypothetical protein